MGSGMNRPETGSGSPRDHGEYRRPRAADLDEDDDAASDGDAPDPGEMAGCIVTVQPVKIAGILGSPHEAAAEHGMPAPLTDAAARGRGLRNKTARSGAKELPQITTLYLRKS